ncbi:sensor histidine kinase [Bacillus sp. B-jedd]|uniref:sensor histidine kinase n=1 Tax=Bacillus sp. B-jedd TaxID=1476857 RepID=UPI0005155525|nr:HAMP domain-containing sensor histidine kinase [Bacillus sp. B-jedd]CEG27016.1 two-component sensor histidine kinase [Bacillus sp. B-jedd]
MGYLKKDVDIGSIGLSQLLAVYECMPDGFLFTNLQKEAVYYNDSLKDILFEEEGTILATEDDFLSLINGCTIRHFDNLPLLQEETDVVLKLTVKINERLKHLSVTKFEVFLQSQPTGTGYLIRDITQEEEILLLKTDLITIASHEFKTPITSLRGSVETLLREDADWDEEFKQDLLEGIHEDLVHLQELVTVWFDIKKIELGTMSLNKHHFPIGQLVTKTIEQLPNEIRCMATIDINMGDYQNLFIYGDRKRLHQVLLNLVVNGLVHNESKHKIISISVTTDDQFVYIHVKDNGLGIEPEYMDKIFERFYKINPPLYGKAHGSGLGLAVCRGLMMEHKGDILVESAPGYGSTFTMKLPSYLSEEGE